MIKNFQNLPKTSGVYLFLANRSQKDKGGKRGRKILYIGKAVNIQERAKQHKDLVVLAEKIDFIKTDSEIEALILEANLIKKYRPKYNIVWKDNKNYFYVGITKEDFPKVFITHQPFYKKDEGTERNEAQIDYIGPFVDGGALKETLKVLRKVFPYRSCNNVQKHPCLWHQLQRCPAPCLLKSALSQQIDGFRKSIIEESRKNTKNLMEILQGKMAGVLKDLKKEMKKTSKSQNFEKAAKIRDQIYSLKKIMSHSKVLEPFRPAEKGTKPCWNFRRIEAYDISNIQGEAATGSMVTFIQGRPDKNFYRKFKIHISGKPNDVAMIKEVLLRRFSHLEWGLPDLILIDGGKAQLNAAIEVKNKKQKTKTIFAAAIAKKHNELFVENRKKPVLLKTLPRGIFNLILQLRDEAHRFARKYHHKLRKIDFLS